MFKHMKDERPKIGQLVVIADVDPHEYLGSTDISKYVKFKVVTWDKGLDEHAGRSKNVLIENENAILGIRKERRMWCCGHAIFVFLCEESIEIISRDSSKYMGLLIERMRQANEMTEGETP